MNLIEFFKCVMCGVVTILLVLLIYAVAHAKSPANAPVDPALAEWYGDLRDLRDTRGVPCCSLADCRPVEWRGDRGRLEVYIDRESFGNDAPDGWVDVPDRAVLPPRVNPVGRAVACFYSGAVLCFVRGSET